IYVTDANGCTATASFQVNEPEEVQVSFNVVNPSYMQGSCNIANGIVTANALGNSGPFTYIWNGGQNGPTLTGITSGLYTVNVIDQVGCIITEQVAVSANNGTGGPIITTNSVSPLNCSGGGSTIDISVYFAGANPTYNWSNGPTTEDITVTQEGTYIVTVTDGFGCQAFEIYEIDNAAPAPVNICMVSVDSVYNTNKVVWEKPFSTDIEYFKVYRESSQAGLYYHVGNIHYDSLSLFVDGVANPMVQAWRYKISSVDFCGKESALSPEHKTIHLNQNLGLLPGTVNLIWDHYAGFSYGTYDIIRYTQSAGWQTVASISSLNTSYTDPAAPLADSTLFYVIEATPPVSCVATRAQNNGTTRSNRTDNPLAPIVSGIDVNTTPVQNFAIYPNPNDGMFTLEMSVNETSNFSVEITDMFGQVVETFQTGNTGTFYKKNVDLRALATGVYLVKIGNQNGYLIKKLIKN
ncbi:MAG: T9SS type A sorting domain-containing protein, partial [Flavobacteriales bacterium]